MKRILSFLISFFILLLLIDAIIQKWNTFPFFSLLFILIFVFVFAIFYVVSSFLGLLYSTDKQETIRSFFTSFFIKDKDIPTSIVGPIFGLFIMMFLTWGGAKIIYNMNGIFSNLSPFSIVVMQLLALIPEGYLLLQTIAVFYVVYRIAKKTK